MAPQQMTRTKAGQRHEIEAEKLTKGCKVILKGEKNAKKRKFNQHEAVVVDVSKQNCWMTVQVLMAENSEVSTLVKWRKGGVREVVSRPIRKDPFEFLGNTQVAANVFSFLEVLENPNLFKVRKLEAQIGLVCKKWKEMLDTCLADWMGLVHCDLSLVRPWQAIPFMDWVASKQLRIGSLNTDAGLGDIPVLARFINEANTQQLTKLRAYVNMESLQQTSRGDFAPISGFFEIERGNSRELVNWSQMVDLTGSEYHEDETTIVHHSAQKYLHETIAVNCPHLADASLRVTLPLCTHNYTECISEAFFSMASISKLKISLSFARGLSRHGSHIEGNCFTNMIRNLVNLKELELAYGGWTELCYLRLFHIESSSLEKINVTGLAKGMYVSCNCPRLEQFICNGHHYGNGVIPRLSLQQYDNLFDEEEENNSDLVTTPSTFIFPRLIVPDTCQMVLKDFFSSSIFHIYNGRFTGFQNCTLQTWDS